MNIAATVVKTNNDSMKIDCAGVEAGAKMLVGLAKDLAESARTDDGRLTKSVLLGHLACLPQLITRTLWSEFDSWYVFRLLENAGTPFQSVASETQEKAGEEPSCGES